MCLENRVSNFILKHTSILISNATQTVLNHFHYLRSLADSVRQSAVLQESPLTLVLALDRDLQPNWHLRSSIRPEVRSSAWTFIRKGISQLGGSSICIWRFAAQEYIHFAHC